MDLQSILANAVQAQRHEQMKTSPQLTLGELILKLEPICKPKLPVVFDRISLRNMKEYHPTGITSWRGSYRELALEYSDEGDPLSLKEFLALLRPIIGATLPGYKGGDYLMGKVTPVWVANHGEVKGYLQEHYTAVIGVTQMPKLIYIRTAALDM